MGGFEGGFGAAEFWHIDPGPKRMVASTNYFELVSDPDLVTPSTR